MVHLTINGRPICEHGFDRCQFSTRREAFNNLLKIDGDVKIEKGPCPHSKEGGT
jgi:hypothetical protein